MLKAPFPYMGGKSEIAPILWDRFGDTLNYVEPFAGSLAVLLSRPFETRIETINDLNCYVANLWRCFSEIRLDPHNPTWKTLADFVNYPISEVDLYARHKVLLENSQKLKRLMRSSPYYYDVELAGFWLYGASQWLGSGFCDTNRKRQPDQRPNLRPKQGLDASYVRDCLPHLDSVYIPETHFENETAGIYYFLEKLAIRLRNVRVVCGDWKRVVTRSVTWKVGLTSIFLDPPYAPETGRKFGIYSEDSAIASAEVRKYCLENGSNELLRIIVAGYAGEHDELLNHGWDYSDWSTQGGMGNINKDGNENRHLERLYYSPHCLDPIEKYYEKKRGGADKLTELPLFHNVSA